MGTAPWTSGGRPCMPHKTCSIYCLLHSKKSVQASLLTQRIRYNECIDSISWAKREKAKCDSGKVKVSKHVSELGPSHSRQAGQVAELTGRTRTRRISYQSNNAGSTKISIQTWKPHWHRLSLTTWGRSRHEVQGVELPQQQTNEWLWDSLKHFHQSHSLRARPGAMAPAVQVLL